MESETKPPVKVPIQQQNNRTPSNLSDQDVEIESSVPLAPAATSTSTKPKLRHRIKSSLRVSKGAGDTSGGSRNSHLRQLITEKKIRRRYMNRLIKRKDSSDNIEEEKVPSTPKNDEVNGEIGDLSSTPKTGTYLEEKASTRSSAYTTSDGSAMTVEVELTEQQKAAMERTSKGMKIVQETLEKYQSIQQEFPIEVRMKQLTYAVPISEKSQKIQTVYNSSGVYSVVKYFKTLGQATETAQTEKPMKKILDNISLSLQPGKMYLVLGPPGCGKTTILKAIAGRLSTTKGEKIKGTVAYNGKTFEDKTKFFIDNAIAYIDQLDRHAPRLTVDETFEFAFQCKRGGTHVQLSDIEAYQLDRDLVAEADSERLVVNSTLLMLGLDHVRDTFVGDDEVRGVSGGQRRRVTCGEMMMGASPILCGDEISNGLDASSTFEIIETLMHLTQKLKKTRVISLLQPSPETVSLFDEIILLAEGHLLYAGPIGKVEEYFTDLGYKAPVYMDVADFLQLISTPDGFHLYDPTLNLVEEDRKDPHTAAELGELFRDSCYGQGIANDISAPHKQVWGSAHDDLEQHEQVDHLNDNRFRHKYANSFPRATGLILKRNMTIWIRDKRVLIANAAKNAIMGVSVGGVFFATDDVVSVLGVLFQGMLFIMLGAMTTAPAFCDERVIFYKQFDSNFYSALPFIIGKAVSKMPQTFMDCMTFGTILYFMVGLAPTFANYATFMAVIFCFSVLMNEYLFVFATICQTKDLVFVISACLVFFFILFSGFIIAPNVIPNYYSWVYWYNPMGWAYRALIVNEYRSEFYPDALGDYILSFAGFVDANGEPFGQVWVLYSFLYMIGHTIVTIVVSALGLTYVRISAESAPSSDPADVAETTNGTTGETSEVQISFKPVTLTFEDVCYDVKASTSNEQLRLLHNVTGAFKSGRMCALMGSSGAGKTTLMDVIAMRKNSGTVQGDVRLNGFPQESHSFRRCSGYVEQFDVQTPQLTVRETVLFSARLRLDSKKVKTDDEKQIFCDQVLQTLELTQLTDCLVGTMEEGGLSFEQKKRLSIAVELAASPSLLFLDEPTTGLDARSALLVVKLLRKIADQGRTVCATIHQPSSAVFDLFDDLLLLKTGGRVVYFGPTGNQSKDLIAYLESHGADRIDLNDNPANWMLREITSSKNPQDLADVYASSPELELLKRRLKDVKDNPVPILKISYDSEFAAPSETRQKLMNKRLQTIYWRSPAYNLSRLLVCIVIAFILGSVFITDRRKVVFSEADMRAWLSVTFLSFIIIGILSITSVLPVMLAIRDVFYRHRAAGMIDNISLGWALGTAEKWFIVIASFLFCLVYIAVIGWYGAFLSRAIRFWGIFTFNLAIYSYFGQAFMCLVSSMQTAQILASVFIGLNNFFSGLIVRPQYLTGFFEITYWITPGHYVYEGLVLAQFFDDNRTVVAVNNSEFYDYLKCAQNNINPCNGTVTQYVYVFFGGRFNPDNELQDIMVLALFLVSARVVTFFALKQFNFSDK